MNAGCLIPVTVAAVAVAGWFAFWAIYIKPTLPPEDLRIGGWTVRARAMTGSECLGNTDCEHTADTSISCTEPYVTPKTLIIAVTLPGSYGVDLKSEWTGYLGTATIERSNQPDFTTSVPLQVRRPENPDSDTTVFLMEISRPFLDLGRTSVKPGALLKIDGGWPRRFSIPDRGFSEAMAELLRRCGEGYSAP